jgi:hypothetical protein
MEKKIRELEIWVADVNGAVVGWGVAATAWRGYIPNLTLPVAVSERVCLA